jgi:putative flippase GtrA
MLSHNALKKFNKYGIVGIGTNVTLYIVFLGLIWTTIEPVLASGLCYVLGLTLSYYFNRRWTFRSESSHRQDISRFLLAYGLGFIVTITSMNILIIFLNPELAQILTIGVAAIAIYIVLHLLKFGQKV